MAVRCLLFSSDEGAAEPIRQVLAGLGVEGEYCSEAAAAIEKVTHQNYQIVIIDWDKQPEAALLLTTARQRKAVERPLTLAIVSDDVSVPKALQAGANSILRKPLQGNQVKDTLATARDLLRAKQESAATAAQAAAAGVSAGASATVPASAGQRQDRPPRTEELPQLSSPAAGPHFVPKSHAPEFVSSFDGIGTSRESETIARPIEDEESLPRPATSTSSPLSTSASPVPSDEARGLKWYLKTRAGASTETPEQPQPPRPSANLELLGYDQPTRSSVSAAPKPAPVREFASESKPKPPNIQEPSLQERKKEAELFAYMDGETGSSEQGSQARPKLGKGAFIGALLLAGCAILAAPQAPWHSQVRAVWLRGQQTVHGLLNPQPVTPVQAPVAHEDFGRAGDEYKLPVEENIPDATTDPSKIQVVPVVDPTAKKPNNDSNPGQPAAAEGAGATANAPDPSSAGQVQEKQLPPSPSDNATSAPGPAVGGTALPTAPIVPLRSDPLPAAPSSSVSTPAPPRNRPVHEVSAPGSVPSSLKSQLASMTPEASGNKAPETALDSIEPVAVPEATERALLTEQPAIAYPANAKGQQGTVILQVTIGRDGTVQDAKFQQGSLAFARAAIDGVREWKFKPYIMNGRPVSVQTLLTMSFRSTQ